MLSPVKNKVVIGGNEVPCTIVKADVLRKVVTADQYVIPAYSEIVLETHITDGDNPEFTTNVD